MTITAEAGATFEAMLSNAPTGLVGSLGVDIENGNGDVFVARTTAGIVEIGAGVYVKDDLIAPVIPGTYYVIWDQGGVFTPEQLIVGPASSLGVHDYISLGEVKETLSIGAQTYADDDIQASITASSRAIDKLCNRRFWKDTGANDRKFYPRAPAVLLIDDLAEFTSFTNVGGSSWVLDTDFWLAPATASSDLEPWTAIRTINKAFTYYGLDASCPTADGRVTIRGKWGWPQIPEAIVEATRILTVRLCRRKREAAFGVIGFGVDGGVMQIARVDPDVQMLIEPYRRFVL